MGQVCVLVITQQVTQAEQRRWCAMCFLATKHVLHILVDLKVNRDYKAPTCACANAVRNT
jgi:hypothetical protein